MTHHGNTSPATWSPDLRAPKSHPVDFIAFTQAQLVESLRHPECTNAAAERDEVACRKRSNTVPAQDHAHFKTPEKESRSAKPSALL